MDPPRDAKDLGHKCSSIRGMYFSTAIFVFCASAEGGRRITRSALRPAWTMRYLFDFEWITTDSSESRAFEVTVSAEPTRTANIDPQLSTWTPGGKLPARYVPANETRNDSGTHSLVSVSRNTEFRAV